MVDIDDRTLEEMYIAIAHLTRRSAEIGRSVEMEGQKVAQWKIENRRRKHNYVPFIVNLIKLLAERGECRHTGVRRSGARQRPPAQQRCGGL